MKWQYALGLLLTVSSQILLLLFACYHLDDGGRSWVWFHQEDWLISLILSVVAVFFIIWGVASDFLERREDEWE